MLQVACRDIGVLGCDFVAEGEKIRKVEYQMLEHLRDSHPQLVAGLTYGQHKELETRIASQARVLDAERRPHEGKSDCVFSVACSELGSADCGFVTADKRLRRLRARVFDHLRDEHPNMITGLTFEEREALGRRIETAAHRR